MREEQVTKHILKWLLDNNWDIVCFDFPQSGTGRYLHPNATADKNKGSINPDIVAVKEEKCLFFENKGRYYGLDFEKINGLIIDSSYSDAIDDLLAKYIVTEYYYGIGLPKTKYSVKAKQDSRLVDFIIGVLEDGEIEALYIDPDKESPFI